MPTAKEAIYDAQISPLMTQIIDICKENKIPMLADFGLGFSEEESAKQLKCTTVLLAEDSEPSPEQIRAAGILYNATNSPVMVTVRDGEGKITESHVIMS